MNARQPDVWQRLTEHYKESLRYFDPHHIVGLFLQGSQNYGLDTPESDVDTKLVIAPTLKQIASAANPVSTTHVRENNEHIDFKDVRLYIQTFRKQNLNFLEILFTPWFIVNPIYKEQWSRLVENREAIAHLNPWRAAKSMQGVAEEKFHALQHRYPSRAAIVDKYGYDPKQLCHLLRIENYLDRYISGEPYESCLNPKDLRSLLLDVKFGKYKVNDAIRMGTQSITHIRDTVSNYCTLVSSKEDPEVIALLDDVQYELIKLALERELSKK